MKTETTREKTELDKKIRGGEVLLKKDGSIWEHLDYVGFGGAGTLIQKNLESGFIRTCSIEGYGEYKAIGKKAPRYIRLLGYKYVFIN